MKRISNEINQLLQRGVDAHISLGVTGLSRAGKTAFITSVTNQLLYSSTHKAMPLLTAQSQGRLLGARQVTQSNILTPTFGYNAAIESLSLEPPIWPKPTTDVGAIKLALRYTPKKRTKKLMGTTATLYVDIVDYPGEWLLDLPLLELSFEQWSDSQYQRLDDTKQALANDWIQAVANLDPDLPCDDQVFNEMANTFRDYLHQCKDHGYHYVQPGRFVLPGEYAGAPILDFFPLPKSAFSNKTVKKSARYVLEQRFEEYKKEIVKPFFKHYFAKFNRQIVLVDLLGSLNQGKHAFEDMQFALEQIIKSFKFGKHSLINRLFSPKTDKLLFATTKIDHVTPEQQKNVDKLLQTLIAPVWQYASFEHVELKTMSVSSIQATEYGLVTDSNGKSPALRGRDMGYNAVTVYPGEVPDNLPHADYWSKAGFEFSPFAPKQYSKLEPLRHIRIDAALEYLLGDKLW
jgi:predicted YcjX-like family ATPase